MFFYRLKTCILALLALLLSCAVCLGVTAGNVCKLSKIQGKRTFYLDSASSQSLRKTTLSFGDLSRVKGECVRFELGKSPSDVQALALEIAKTYDA